MKEEDINILPENTDVSEIDKLTGIPKANGMPKHYYYQEK
jgi:hypothetical protein